MKWFVTFFGVGNSKWAPGTMGTLAAIPLVYLVQWVGPFVYMAFTLALTIVSVFIVEKYENSVTGHDRKEIVIDEVIGYLITMTWMPQTWQAYVMGFVLFRIFDIWKPLFIGQLDKRVKGGLGVVVDDVAAGVVASIIMQLIYVYTPIFGERLIVQ